jgi:hypothetical protein
MACDCQRLLDLSAVALWGRIARNAGDDAEQRGRGKGLPQEGRAPGPLGAIAERFINERGNDDDRNHRTGRAQTVLQVDAGNASQLDIEDQAQWASVGWRVDERFGGREERRFESRGEEQPAEGGARRGVVFDDGHKGGRRVSHGGNNL